MRNSTNFNKKQMASISMFIELIQGAFCDKVSQRALGSMFCRTISHLSIKDKGLKLILKYLNTQWVENLVGHCLLGAELKTLD
jgi:hypothetical protein